MTQPAPRLAAVCLVAIATTACFDEVDLTESARREVAHVEIVNAADIADVEVRLVGNNTTVAVNLDFRGSTAGCVEIPQGNQTLAFSSASAELARVTFPFVVGSRYTAVLVSSGATRRAVVRSDAEVATPGNVALRFINATAATGDVWVARPGPIQSGIVAASNLGILATGAILPQYVQLPTTHTVVSLFDPGTVSTPRAEVQVSSLPATGQATVVFTGPGTPAGPTAFVTQVCPDVG